MTPPDKTARSRGLSLVSEVDPPPDLDGTVLKEDWTRDLPRKKTGDLKNTFAVVCAILRNDPEYRGTFWYDELWLEPRRGEQIFDDENEYLKIRERIELRYELGTISEANAYHAVHLVAKERSRHPVKAYLDGLIWDGVPRLHTWLTRYLGASGNEAYLVQVGTWTLQGAVARIYEPGCQVDYVMVLEGDQGLQKSSVLRSLVPNQDWVAAHQAELNTKDAYQVLDGKWLLEIDEVDRLSKHELGHIKAFVTRRSDHYRRTWAKKARTYHRQSMFLATCNCAEYLHDPRHPPAGRRSPRSTRGPNQPCTTGPCQVGAWEYSS
jgi:predicted P-loop ATPase